MFTDVAAFALSALVAAFVFVAVKGYTQAVCLTAASCLVYLVSGAPDYVFLLAASILGLVFHYVSLLLESTR